MDQGQTLLLVEDDGATGEVLALLLGAEGWTVHAAGTGEDALAWIAEQSHAPAVALCDLHLPGICGESLADALHDAAPSICVLAMSASATAPVRGYASGLLKPFPPSAVEQEWVRFTTATRSDTCAVVADGPAGVVSMLPIVDEATLLTLQTSMGATGTQGLYSFALADTGDRLRRMQTAIATGDAAVYIREAHAVKGSCGMIGARRLWQLAGDAEMEGLGPASNKKVTRMFDETEAVRLMLEALFPVAPHSPG